MDAVTIVEWMGRIGFVLDRRFAPEAWRRGQGPAYRLLGVAAWVGDRVAWLRRSVSGAPEVLVTWDEDDGVLVIGQDAELRTTDPGAVVRELREAGARVIFVDLDACVESILEPLR